MPSRFLFLGFAVAALVLPAAEQPYTDVPYVPTTQKVVDAMLDLAAIHAGDRLVDLGSGDGRIAVSAARRFGIEATGVEIDPELVRQAQALAEREGVAQKVRFVRSDLFTYDLRQASVVTMFLTPGVNLRLRARLLAELRPGTRVVSHRFDMGSWAPARTVRVDDDQVYLWVIPAGAPVLAVPVRPPAAVPFEKLAAAFAYDPTASLDPHADPPREARDAEVTGISYSGARGPVSATIVTPARKGRHPAVIFVHDYGRRDEFLPEALLEARASPPAVSLLIDAPADRPVGWRRSFNALNGDNDRDIHIQAVIDIRRGIDLLEARGDVDAARIAYAGHGYGANWGAILASVEPRLRAFVLIAGFPSFSEVVESDDPDWANTRYALGRERCAAYEASLSAVDPIRFTPYAGAAPVLAQFGRFDAFVSRAMALRLAGSLPGSPQPVFYDAGHSVNDPRALMERSRFLARAIHSGAVREREMAR